MSASQIMSKILAVFGATGQQGSSVANYVLHDPSLSHEYKIRAITRDVNSEKSQQLKSQSVEVVQADVLDRSSLEAALSGVHTVFAMTTPSFGHDAVEAEFERGKAIADVAAEKGVQYLIFSTLPAVREISAGKYTNVGAFDSKAKIESYIRGLSIKSAFVSLGSFMENFQAQPFLAPRVSADGAWVMKRHVPGKTKMPLLDAVGDTGKFVGAILAEPEKFEGKRFCAAEGLYSLDEICAAISKSTGERVMYEQIPVGEFRDMMGLPEVVAAVFVDGFSFGEEFGYFGPGEEKLIKWGKKNARGTLSTLDEYFVAHPLKLV